MSDSTKYVITNYISVHISTFWVPFLEGWVILNFLFPTNPYGAPKRVKMCVLIKINATIKFFMQNYEYI